MPGTITATIGGEERELCLTLTALLELETKLGNDKFWDLALGKIDETNSVTIVAAGLRAAGTPDDDVAQMTIEGGIVGAVAIAKQLIDATWGIGR